LTENATAEERREFDAKAGLVERRVMPSTPDIPEELHGVAPPAWWVQ
jgi:hypothetical protein